MTHEHDFLSHIRSLRRYAVALVGNPADADDLVQECLKRVLTQVRSDMPIINLRAYLFRTLRNIRFDALRHAEVEGVEVSLDDVVASLHIPADQETHLQCRDMVRGLYALLEEQREAVLLVCLEGLSYEDVAAIASVPVGTVRSRLHRGREKLRRYVAGSMAMESANKQRIQGDAELTER